MLDITKDLSNSQPGWGWTMEEMVVRLRSKGSGLKLSLIGKPGFGKSAFMTVISQAFPKALVVDGDILTQFAHKAQCSVPPSEKIGGNGNWWDEVRQLSPEDKRKRRAELFGWLQEHGYLDGIDLTCDVGLPGFKRVLMLPDYKFYHKLLSLRNKLREGAEHGRQKPILTYEEFASYIEEKFPEATYSVPNLSPHADQCWVNWWRSVIIDQEAKVGRK